MSNKNYLVEQAKEFVAACKKVEEMILKHKMEISFAIEAELGRVPKLYDETIEKDKKEFADDFKVLITANKTIFVKMTNKSRDEILYLCKVHVYAMAIVTNIAEERLLKW